MPTMKITITAHDVKELQQQAQYQLQAIANELNPTPDDKARGGLYNLGYVLTKGRDFIRYSAPLRNAHDDKIGSVEVHNA